MKNLENTARQLEARNRTLETSLQEKDIRYSRAEADLRHVQEKLDNMENIHKKEQEAQKERVCLFLPIVLIYNYFIHSFHFCLFRHGSPISP